MRNFIKLVSGIVQIRIAESTLHKLTFFRVGSRCIDLMQSRRNVQKIDFMKAVIYTIGWVVFKAKAGSYKYTIMYVYIIEHFKSFVNFCSCFSSLR